MNIKKNREFVFWWIFFAILIFLSFYFDNRIVMLVSLLRTPGLTSFFLTITSTVVVIMIFVLLTALFVKEKRRKMLLPLWLAVAVSYIISIGLKILIQRQRPFELGLVSAVINSSYSWWDFSFPSSHAILVFSVVPFLSKEFPKFKYVWIVFACLVAFSRVYLGLHFLSDVIVGGLIGYLTGFIILRRAEGKF